jgi:hypothetical protein
MVLFDDPDSSTPEGPDTDDYKSFLRKIRIFTTQGHPEFHASIMSKLVENRARSGILSPAVAADARARNELEAQEPVDGDGTTGEEGAGKKNTWVNNGVDVGEVIWGILGL